MKILKAMMSVEGDNIIFLADVIRHKGKNWIVPNWLENPLEGWKMPERIVCLDTLKHQKAQFGAPPKKADFVVNVPVPKSVLYGPDPLPANSGYLVVRQPDIRIPIPRGIH